MREKIKNKIERNGEYGLTSNHINYDIFKHNDEFFVVASTQGSSFNEQSKQVLSDYQELTSYVFKNKEAAIEEFASILEANGISL